LIALPGFGKTIQLGMMEKFYGHDETSVDFDKVINDVNLEKTQIDEEMLHNYI
jgi:hypothetical protein